MQVTKYLTVESRLPAVQHPHYLPLPARKRDSTTEPQPWIALGNGFAYYYLALARREHATGAELDMVTHLEPCRCQTANRHVHAIGRINAGQIDHLHQLERGRRLVVFERCNAALEFDVLILLRRHAAVELGIGPLAEHEHVLWAAGGLERCLQARYQRQHYEEYRYWQRNAKGRQEGGGLALDQVADIVADGQSHGLTPQGISRDLSGHRQSSFARLARPERARSPCQ